MIHHDDPPVCASKDCACGGEGEAEYTFAWMVSIGRSGIYSLISVVNEVKTPHPLHLVFRPVYKIGSDQVEKQKTCDHIEPGGHVRKPLKNTKLVINGPGTPFQQKKC